MGRHRVIYRCEQVEEEEEGDRRRRRREGEGSGATWIKSKEQRDGGKETAINEWEPEGKD